METLTLQIKDKKRKRFLLELLTELDFVEIMPNASQLTPDEKRFVSGLQEALKDVELHRQGKKPLKTAQQLIAEL